MTRQTTSPVTGQLLSCPVKARECIEADTETAVVEAMKMRMPVSAVQAGRVAKWRMAEKPGA